jgi:hypothetical protein
MQQRAKAACIGQAKKKTRKQARETNVHATFRQNKRAHANAPSMQKYPPMPQRESNSGVKVGKMCQ